MPAHRDGEAGTGAGVRKPPGKEPASRKARRFRERYGDFGVADGSLDWGEQRRAEKAGLPLGWGCRAKLRWRLRSAGERGSICCGEHRCERAPLRPANDRRQRCSPL